MITDTEARRIADQWHGGGGTALYAFASTGAIDTARADHQLWLEVSRCIQELPAQPDRDYSNTELGDLLDLANYISHTGPRGPQPGWNNLTW